MHRRSGALTAALMMLGSSYCDMLFGVVRGILVMNLLGPTGRGIMRLVAMVHKYLTHAHLGILHGVSKELPQALGRKDFEKADEIESVGATYVTLSGIVGGAGMLLFGCLSNYGPSTKAALMAGGGILVTLQSYAFYRTVIRAWGLFPVLAGASVVNTVSEFVLILLGARYFHIMGAMLGWLLADILSILYFRFASRLVVPVSFDWRVALCLAVTGLPIALIIFSETLLRTVDGIIVVGHYSAYRFGLYSVAMQMATYLTSIPSAAGFVIMPRIIESYAANGDLARVRRQIMVPTIAAAALMPVLAGCAFIMLPPAIRTVVPKFEGCIFAAQVLSLASVFLSLPVAANGLLIAINREWLVVMNNILGAGVIYVAASWQANRGGSLRDVAVATSAGYLLSGLLSVVQVLGRYHASKWELVWQVAMSYLPFGWGLVALRLSGWLTHSPTDPLGSDWCHALIRLVLFLGMMLPVLLYGNSRTGVFGELKRAARKVLRRKKGNNSSAK
jgi:O-antigen/teichoic acid export membrane protein